jgi:hypothetical protein
VVRMAGFTARVPDHGWVDWDEDTVREYAFALQARHQPRRRAWSDASPTCVACGLVWPCLPSRWASEHAAGAGS